MPNFATPMFGTLGVPPYVQPAIEGLESQMLEALVIVNVRLSGLELPFFQR